MNHPAPESEREAIALEDLPMFWQCRAKALRILARHRGVPDTYTDTQIETYEECANELRAILSRRGEPVAEPLRVGVKSAVTWLLSRAREMNDPNAKAILNSAAFSLGQDLKYREHELAALAASPPAPALDVRSLPTVDLPGEEIVELPTDKLWVTDAGKVYLLKTALDALAPALDTGDKSPPVCCYCDHDLSCGRCGMEQPYDDISILKARIRELEAAPALDARTVELERLVRCLIDNDPDELAADGGIRVIDVWRKEAERALRADQGK